MTLKYVHEYTYIPLTLLGYGGVWEYRIKGASVYPTKYKKKEYTKESL